ncbi:MAG TPA: hypothetical protein VJ397_04405 [Thermoplasmata archaeon]|nr:hypothetical protein [Thermoplasmata archaeon]
MRGWNGFARQPYLLLILPLVYYTYFALLEDLIGRYRLREYQAVLITFFFGLFYEVLGTGVVFTATGIDWFAVFYVGLLWWGLLQTLLTFYFANRVWPRHWEHPRLGAVGWSLGLLTQALVLLLFARNPLLPKGPAWAYAVMVGLAAGLFALVAVSVKLDRGGTRPFTPSSFLDALALGTFALFLFSGTFLTAGSGVGAASYINELAVSVITKATLLIAILVAAVAVYYRVKRTEFPF